MHEIFMTDTEQKRWVFWCNEKHELCYRKDGEKPEILQQEMSDEFDLVTDGQGRFHLIAQDRNGCIIYLFYDRIAWRKYRVLASRNQTRSISCFKVFYINDKICAFYILEHNERAMLVHHIFDRAHFSVSPSAVDVLGTSKSFAVAVDDSFDCHLLYIDQSETLQYKVYKWSTKSYLNRPCPIQDETRHVSAVCDRNDVLHLAYLTRMKNYFTVCYWNFLTRVRKVLSFGVDGISSPMVMVQNGQVRVQWKERDMCCECISNDNGETFRKPTPIDGTRGKSCIPVSVCGGADPLRKGIDRCIRASDGPSIISGNNTPTPRIQTPGQEVEEFALHHANLFTAQKGSELAELRANLARHETELLTLKKQLEQLKTSLSSLHSPSLSKDVGEINEENLKRFEQMQMDDLDFSDSPQLE
ncbi:MAG: hypothetical protein E7409_04170 [Ruminococcaceae bacterium]|nr:hypothetical protein [Oscillospiraceae bacterium]